MDGVIALSIILPLLAIFIYYKRNWIRLQWDLVKRFFAQPSDPVLQPQNVADPVLQPQIVLPSHVNLFHVKVESFINFNNIVEETIDNCNVSYLPTIVNLQRMDQALEMTKRKLLDQSKTYILYGSGNCAWFALRTAQVLFDTGYNIHVLAIAPAANFDGENTYSNIMANPDISNSTTFRNNSDVLVPSSIDTLRQRLHVFPAYDTGFGEGTASIYQNAATLHDHQPITSQYIRDYCDKIVNS